MIRSSIKKIFILLIAFVIAAVIFLYWAHLPRDAQEAFVVSSASTDQAAPTTLKVISYNIAYGRGAEDDIIVGPRDAEAITTNLNGIALLLKTRRADIVFLQEVDLASKRTFFIDEVKYLADRARYPSYACVTNWVKNYVPFPYWPPDRNFGKMKSGQCILSKFPILENKRIALPQSKNDPFYYSAFDLTRAIQSAKVQVGDNTFNLFNVHQEAFDIANREEQARILAAIVNENPSANTIVAGDFNSIPPNAPLKKGFEKQNGKHWREDIDLTNDNSLETFISLTPNFYEALSSFSPDETFFTYPSDGLNRRIDYIFVSNDMRISDAGTIKKAGILSDHLPVFADVKKVGDE